MFLDTIFRSSRLLMTWLLFSLLTLPFAVTTAYFGHWRDSHNNFDHMLLAAQSLLMLITLVFACEYLRLAKKSILLARRPARALNCVRAFSFLTFDKTTLIL